MVILQDVMKRIWGLWDLGGLRHVRRMEVVEGERRTFML